MKLNPEGVQNLQKRTLIYKYIALMLQRRGYQVKEDCAPFATKIPTTKGFLLISHQHAERAGFEPVYVMFCKFRIFVQAKLQSVLLS